MKVGILTFHNTSNYGAAFQAYATQHVIQSFGYQSEIIDYVNSARSGKYGIKTRLKNNFKKRQYISGLKYLAGFMFVALRNKAFSQFYEKKMIFSEKKFNETNISAVQAIYDVHLIGSDQVWNYKNNGCDINYALAFAGNKPKVSYASSFGVDSYPNDVKKLFRPFFKAIQNVSVREASGAKLLESITGQKPEVVVDPVFLLTKQEWFDVADCDREANKSGVFCYFNNKKYLSLFQDHRGDFLKDEKILQVSSDFSVNNLISSKYKFLANASPQRFLQLLHNSKFVITSSFHGVVLSIIFEKDFIVFLSGDTGRDSRIVDLLSMFGLSSRVFDRTQKINFSTDSICYERVSSIVQKEVLRSKKYLLDALISSAV